MGGRLSQDEIERMVSEAEKYKAEDDANRNRIESKNGLENYCYSLKGSISGDEVASKMDPADKTTLEGKIEETYLFLVVSVNPGNGEDSHPAESDDGEAVHDGAKVGQEIHGNSELQSCNNILNQ